MNFRANPTYGYRECVPKNLILSIGAAREGHIIKIWMMPNKAEGVVVVQGTTGTYPGYGWTYLSNYL